MVRSKTWRRSAALLVLSSALVPASAQADTLREALARAYETNPTLEAARAQQRATDEDVPIQLSRAGPDVSAVANHIEFVKVSPNSFTAPERRFQGGIDVTVPIYSGGAVKNGIKAAKERVTAGQADLRGTESSIFSQVVAAYMDVLRTEALAALAGNQVDVLSVNLEATNDRFEIGELTRTDIAQSQSRLAIAQSDFRNAQANLIAARETYIQLIGSAPNDLQAPPPLPGLPDTVGEAVTVALEYNPDLIAAKERAEAAGYDSEVAGAGRLPTIGGFVNYDYTDFFGTLGGPISANFAQDETTANVGVQLTIPLYQGGRPAAQQRQAYARENAALENVIATERNVIAQTRSAYSSWQASQAVIKSSQAAVDAAELSLEGVRAENSIGNRTILDVLNAEQELLSARAQLVTARRNAYVAGFSVLAAMGRAEARDLNLDTGGVLYDPIVNYDRVRNKIFDWHRDPEPEAKSTRTVDIPAPDAMIGPLDESGDAKDY
ncbi:TolC family outer membrane protein [Altererythrobacter sp.]|uniref:TolC family outer membrane protein n=1 Tax=Altererythrobacter sp. TaxID=1872480 RepID=UPI001AFF8A65|nr:TolC family outer membrane protein [Altererythrobacter sp.]MBO6609416.1 TolC family outer membrane protein [Altererythrobacter sp.]MBO6642283.1 TolC family outer membrane protein [Altererythrobacter sp.]MBO6709209.1 TolC family outer membrane protein [Altererythrobacter sp.]